MSTPSGQRPTQSVYIRRRIVVGVLIVVVVGLVFFGIGTAAKALFGGKPEPKQATAPVSSSAPDTPKPAPASGGSSSPSDTEASSSASGSASESASPSESGSPSEGEATVGTDGKCPEGMLKLTASTDKPSYDANQKPVLVLTVENTGDVACTAEVGTASQEFVVTSGSDRIFSTKDCQKDPATATMELKPGTKESARFTWERSRSAPDCAPVSSKPRPGTYMLQVSLGDVDSKKAAFDLK